MKGMISEYARNTIREDKVFWLCVVAYAIFIILALVSRN